MSGLCQGFGLFGAGSSAGVSAELVALGAMDTYLIKGASVTFWRFRYARYTNFAMEAVGQPFQSQPVFGGHSQIILNRVGDLIYYMYAVIDLPGIYAVRRKGVGACDSSDYEGCEYNGRAQFPSASSSFSSNSFSSNGSMSSSDFSVSAAPSSASVSCSASAIGSPPSVEINANKPWVHWHNAVGQLLIRRAVLVVGGHQTDTLYSDYLYMWEELSGKAGKRLREMIGKRKSRAQLIKDASHDQRLYVPLPWYFTQTSGNALPLCSLQFHGVSVHVEWERLNKAVIVSHEGVEVRKCRDGTKLTQNDLQAWLDTTYIHLDIEERNRFALANFDQLMTQVQFAAQQSSKGSTVNIPVLFNHPVIELIWAVRRKANEARNNYFNYSSHEGRDPIQEVSLRLNNLLRFSGREGRYYRLVQPYQFHSSIPKAHVYSYSFALFPEEAQPSGSINLSRIDNVDFGISLDESLANEAVTVLLFGRNWNILRFTEGLCGVRLDFILFFVVVVRTLTVVYRWRVLIYRRCLTTRSTEGSAVRRVGVIKCPRVTISFDRWRV